MSEPLWPARIIAIHYEATDTLSFTLMPLNGELESIEPGSHIDVELPNGLLRSYSLSNGLDQNVGYRLTVARDQNSRGGSASMHSDLRAGQIVKISKPRNNFPLNEEAKLSVFIGGGIGVTPFLPMMRRLNELGKPWRLHYCLRTKDRAALVSEIETLASQGKGELLLNFDEEPGGAMLDLGQTLAALPEHTHVYCCGPTGMLDAFIARAKSCNIPEDHVHFEYFSSDVESATDGGYTVVLSKSGKEVVVEPGQTMLHALLNSGVNLSYSCEEGICGACETRVIEGTPDHRDRILSDQEKQQSKTVIVCCSGSKSARLVLDL